MAKVSENINLKNYNTFGIESFAKYFYQFENENELQAIIKDKKYQKEAKLILGGGSNVLFVKNYNGIVLLNEIKGIKLLAEDEKSVKIQFGAGENWHESVLYCIENNYAGIENLSLIPGKIGASPIQNIGAYGVELKDVFESLTAINLKTAEVVNFTKKDCNFGYRNSVFKNELKGEYAICNVVLKLQKQAEINMSYGAIKNVIEAQNVENVTIKTISDAVIKIRSEKLPDPKVIGNSGSFFKNPVVENNFAKDLKTANEKMPSYPFEAKTKIAAGWLIEQCGFKGIKIGNTGTYKNQALVLVNRGNATGNEIFNFSEKIIETVNSKFGITLEREVNVI